MRTTECVMQAEVSECGLACLAMILQAHRKQVSLQDLRQRFDLSLKGASLEQLMDHASALGFSGRPLRLDLDELEKLQLPCILHWDLNHFVVLCKVGRKSVTLLDPALGERSMPISQLSSHFTGVALELTPSANFAPPRRREAPDLTRLTGPVRGLGSALLQILAVASVLEGLAILAPQFNQLVVDDVVTSHDGDLLTVLAIGFGLLLLIQAAISLARSWMVLTLGQTVAVQWFANVFAHLVRLPVNWFEKRHLGDISSRFGSIRTIQQTLTTAMVEVVLDGCMAIFALGMLLLYSARLTAVVAAAVAAYGLVRWASYRPLRNAASERLAMAARENTHFLETMRAMSPIKLFGREEERRAAWQNLMVNVQNREAESARINIVVGTVNTLVFGCENIVVLWLSARMIMDSRGADAAHPAPVFTVGMMFAFLAYKMQFTQRFASLVDFAVQLRMLPLQFERLADITASPPERDLSLAPGKAREAAALAPTLELRNVSYRYGDGEPWVLRNASMKIEAGESVAIVGASSAGKTTALKILLGILQPSAGHVLYGGKPVQRLGLANVRRCIGTVMQDDILLSGTVAENICFFDRQPDHAWIRDCARVARLHEEVEAMPMGYSTLVGDLGTGLSGGQKQRVLLARALYKRPQVLALDEATSHLDVSNERCVSEALARMRLTRLMVAHRPETIASASRVIQIRNGQIGEILRPVEASETRVASA